MRAAGLQSLTSCTRPAEPNLPTPGSERGSHLLSQALSGLVGCGSGQEVVLNHSDSPLESCLTSLTCGYRD